MLRHLPKKARALWEATYRNLRAKGYDVEKSARIAWAVVKKKYVKRKGRWVAKSIKIKHTIVKNGLFNSDYIFRIELTNTKRDIDNQKPTAELLERLVKENKIAKIGDIEHERFYRDIGRLDLRRQLVDDENTEGLYELMSYEYKNGSVYAVIKMNKNHKLFNKYLKLHKQGKFLYASAEFINAELNNNGEIIDADELSWSITDYPANYNLDPIFELDNLERIVNGGK